MRKRKCECADGVRISAENKTPRHLLVALYWLVVVAYQVAHFHHPCADYCDFRTQEAEAEDRA